MVDGTDWSMYNAKKYAKVAHNKRNKNDDDDDGRMKVEKMIQPSVGKCLFKIQILAKIWEEEDVGQTDVRH